MEAWRTSAEGGVEAHTGIPYHLWKRIPEAGPERRHGNVCAWHCVVSVAKGRGAEATLACPRPPISDAPARDAVAA